MDKEVILDNEYITVWYYNSKKIVHHEFHQFTRGKILRHALSEGAAVLEKNGAKKWLADDRNSPVMKQDDLDWTAKVWRPMNIKAGWKYWAIVVPEAVTGQMVIKKVIKEYAGLGVTVQTFSDPEKAMNWLETL